MDSEIAEKLIKGLERHGKFVVPDRKLFLGELTSTDVPESSRFYETLPGETQIVEEADRYHSLSLRRVLRNRNVGRKPPEWKEAYGFIASTLGIYSSDVLTRSLRRNEALVEMMAQCEEPFSLLGKFQSFSFGNPGNQLVAVTRPVLVIPGVENLEPIYAWEDANTTYEKEIRLIGIPTRREIKAQEYLSH